MKSILRFENVTFYYGMKQIIDNLTFSLTEGEIISFLGPSGCGKTTILNLAASITSCEQGSIALDTDKIGYVFQEPRLLPWKTVLENVLFVIDHGNKQERTDKAKHFLQEVGLENAMNEYPRKLSGGMRQRVSFARALASEPKILLMDEPFSALNMELKYKLQEDIIRLIENNHLSGLYVTHDLEEALKISNKIFNLSQAGCKIEQEEAIHVNRLKRNDLFINEMKAKIRQGREETQ